MKKIPLLFIIAFASCHESQNNRRMELYHLGIKFAKQDINFPPNSKFHPEPESVAYDSFENAYTVKGVVDAYDSLGRLNRLIWVDKFRTIDHKNWVRADDGTMLFYFKGVPTEIK